MGARFGAGAAFPSLLSPMQSSRAISPGRLALAGWLLLLAGLLRAAAPEPIPGSFSLVVLPDTQLYASAHPEIYRQQIQWVMNQRERYQIVRLLHVGDITHRSTVAEWNVAREVHARHRGVLPAIYVPGNHDYPNAGKDEAATTLFSQFFPLADYRAQGGLVAVYDREPERAENSAHRFTAGGRPWLVLALEFGPRSDVLRWANGVVAAHPDHTVIVLTHAYLRPDGQRYSRARAQATGQPEHGLERYRLRTAAGGLNDGEDLWRQLVSRHANIALVLCGHVCTSAHTVSRGAAGNAVHEILVDYQTQKNGGNGWLRLLQFLPDGRTVRVRDYSPTLDETSTQAKAAFDFTLDPPPAVATRSAAPAASGLPGAPAPRAARAPSATPPASASRPPAAPAPTPAGPAVVPADLGYRGIWFTLGQFSEYGDKYSGGLGTYTANHNPLAVYAPAVERTFFVYGGVPSADSKHLLCMVGAYDHRTGRVARPVVVHDKLGVDDPHDNPSLNLDGDGHLWVFVSGRANKRPGFVYRSVQPYAIDRFERVAEKIITYPQPWYEPGRGFLLLFTRYTKGRELYWETGPDGRTWSETRKLAGFGGHYQTSGMGAGKVASFFNYHPGGNVDRRTNLYYAQTTDFGRTWTTAAGQPLTLPLAQVQNAALVRDYQAEGLLLYTCDLNFDAAGRPILLYVLSRDHRPGPAGGPRAWTVAHWTGQAWEYATVTTSDHNYDMGSLYVDGAEWRVLAPTEVGPQAWGGGGEMALWTSRDQGRTWQKERQVTRGSPRNHNYARRPRAARDPFFAFWADGDPGRCSESRLYFSDARGEHVWRLPDTMTEAWLAPEPMRP